MIYTYGYNNSEMIHVAYPRWWFKLFFLDRAWELREVTTVNQPVKVKAQVVLPVQVQQKNKGHASQAQSVHIRTVQKSGSPNSQEWEDTVRSTPLFWHRQLSQA